MAHQFFQDLQWHAGIEQLRGKGMPRPFLCWVTSEAPATKSLTLSHKRNNSRWYLQAIPRAGERVICREQHQKARYTPCAVLAGEREVAGDIQIMPHIRRSILSTTC